MNWTWAAKPGENCAQVRKRIVSNNLHIYDSRTTPRWCTFFIQAPSDHLHITRSLSLFVLTSCFHTVLCAQSSWMSWMKQHLHTVFFLCFTCRTHTRGYNSLGYREAQFILNTHDFSCPVKYFIHSAHFIWNHWEEKIKRGG